MMIRHRLRPLAFLVGFGGAALLALTAVGLDRGFGQDVLLIAPHDEAAVELNRGLYSPPEPVAALYGNALSKPVRVILPAEDHLIRPEEDPSLVLLKVDKQKGENPLQAQTVWFLAKFVLPGLFLMGLAGFLLPRRRVSMPA